MGVSAEEIRNLGELQTVEFKKSLSLRDKGFEQLCGMINADSAVGNVFFGVAPDGTIVGIDPGNLDSVQQGLARSIREKFEPPLIHEIHVLTHGDKNIILLKATRAATIPYHEYDGRAYIREGTSSRVLTLAEKQHLVKMRDRDQHNGPWYCANCKSLVMQLAGNVVYDGTSVRKHYKCSCGGEYWPI